MRSRLFLVVVIAVAAVVLAVTAVSGEDETATPASALTEDGIRKMRIKELRQALWERDVECVACTQKEDLAARLLEVMSKPVVRTAESEAAAERQRKAEHEKQRRAAQEAAEAAEQFATDQDDMAAAAAEAAAAADESGDEIEQILRRAGAGGSAKKEERTKPKRKSPPKPHANSDNRETFEQYWTKKARTACETTTTPPQPPKSSGVTCGKFAVAVISQLSGLIRGMGKTLGKSEERVTAVSKSQPYAVAGERALTKAWKAVAAHVESNAGAVVDGTKLKELVSGHLSQWFLNTIMENPQQMFSGGDFDIEEMLKYMKPNGGGAGGKYGGPPPPPPPPRRPPPPPPPPASDEAEAEPAADEHTEL